MYHCKRVLAMLYRFLYITSFILCALYFRKHLFNHEEERINIVKEESSQSQHHQQHHQHHYEKTDVKSGLTRDLSLHFTCVNINDVKVLSIFGMGLLTTTYLGVYKGSRVLLLKTKRKIPDCTDVAFYGSDTDTCLAIVRENNKTMSRPDYSKILNHGNIMTDLGCCTEGHEGITEHGFRTAVCVQEMTVRLTWPVYARWTWHKRLREALELIDLLEYLEDTHYGSFRIEGNWRDCFHLVGDNLLLTTTSTLTNDHVDCDHVTGDNIHSLTKMCKILKDNGKVIVEHIHPSDKSQELTPKRRNKKDPKRDFNAFYNLYELDRIIFADLLYLRADEYSDQMDLIHNSIQTAKWTSKTVKKMLKSILDDSDNFAWKF